MLTSSATTVSAASSAIEPVPPKLTADERKAFERDGFLRIPAALPLHMVHQLSGLADRYHAERCAEGDLLNVHDLVGKEDIFLTLVDWPATFTKVWGVLGWNIQNFHTQLMLTPSKPRGEAKAWGWHKDNNRMNRDIEVALQPRISVKIAYFLTDCLEPGDGSLAVVPGSHLLNEVEWSPTTKQPVNAVELSGRAGDAVLFDRRLFHAGAPNYSGRPRKVLYYGYSYRWLRPKSSMRLEELRERCPPIMRQLLGHATTANGTFEPLDEDVPLRAWIKEHYGAAAVVP